MPSDSAERRPAIPTEIRRRVLVEAGHRCAIPTCRYIEVELHHIIPWAETHEHTYDNLIALCANCHRRADLGTIDRKSLRLYKHNLRFTHEKYSQLEMDMMFDLYKSNGTAPWVPFMMIFFRRIIESNFVEIFKNQSISIGWVGVDNTPLFLKLTSKGRKFIEDLGLHEIDESQLE